MGRRECRLRCRRSRPPGPSWEVRLEGLCSHFANADLADAALTQQQILLPTALAQTAPRDVSRSGATSQQRRAAGLPEVRDGWSQPGAARPGLYGLCPPRGSVRRAPWSRPPLEDGGGPPHTVPTGTPSPTEHLTAPRARIATPGYYADGWSRLSNRGSVLVGGRRAPVVGRVQDSAWWMSPTCPRWRWAEVVSSGQGDQARTRTCSPSSGDDRLTTSSVRSAPGCRAFRWRERQPALDGCRHGRRRRRAGSIHWWAGGSGGSPGDQWHPTLVPGLDGVSVVR